MEWEARARAVYAKRLEMRSGRCAAGDAGGRYVMWRGYGMEVGAEAERVRDAGGGSGLQSYTHARTSAMT